MPLSLFAFLPEECEREVDALDLTEPAFPHPAAFAEQQVFFEFVETGQHLRVNLENGAPKASVFMRTGRAIRSAAVAELDLSLVEVFLKFTPLGVAGRPVFVVGSQVTPSGEMGLVVADQVFLEDRDIAASGSEIEMALSRWWGGWKDSVGEQRVDGVVQGSSVPDGDHQPLRVAVFPVSAEFS